MTRASVTIDEPLRVEKAVLLALALWVVCSGCQTTPDSFEPIISRVVRIRGNARSFTDDRQTWHALKADAWVRSGTTVQTAKDSYADIVLGDEDWLRARFSGQRYFPRPTDWVRLKSDSVIVIGKVGKSTTKENVETRVVALSLESGRITGDTQSHRTGLDFTVALPECVAHIAADTAYDITTEGVVRVLSGKVTLVTATNLLKEIVADQQFDLRSNVITQIPLNLYPGPIIICPAPIVVPQQLPAVAPRRRF